MILAITLAVISIAVLLAIVVMMLLNKPNSFGLGLLFFLYLYNLVNESLMLYTALNRIRNHFLANIHTLVAGIAVFFILKIIWERLTDKQWQPWVFPSVSLALTLVWGIDNFIIHPMHTFNPFAQAIISMVNLCLVVYLLNLMMFIKKKPGLFKVYLFFILAFLIYCFSNILVDSFFNKYLNFSSSFYLILGSITQAFGIVSHFFILLGVIWMFKARNFISP